MKRLKFTDGTEILYVLAMTFNLASVIAKDSMGGKAWCMGWRGDHREK